MIELYTAPTPNGHKVSCTLEALEMDYKAILVNLSEGEQKKPDFLKISPNGRIPAIIDTSNNLSIFESGAIMIYLADKANNLISSGVITGGMIPKILTCISCLKEGVSGVVIIDGRKPHAVLYELFSEAGAGTLIVND